MDNSLVYGEVFGFDTALWDIWNITKNLANFALGFLFLYSIFMVVIGKKTQKDIFKIIKNTLLAGVLIQASWFITAAAVDISSIATYGIGGLPLSALKGENPDKTQQELLGFKFYSDLNTSTDKMDTAVFLTTKNHVISYCEIAFYNDKDGLNAKKDEGEPLIVGRGYLYYSDSATKQNTGTTN
jgi:hypothetical protein